MLLCQLILPRDAMHSADYAVLRCLSVRLFVCLSHARRRVASHTILVFPYQWVWQHFDGDLLSGASNASRFSTISDRQTRCDHYLELNSTQLNCQLSWVESGLALWSGLTKEILRPIGVCTWFYGYFYVELPVLQKTIEINQSASGSSSTWTGSKWRSTVPRQRSRSSMTSALSWLSTTSVETCLDIEWLAAWLDMT